MALAVLSIDLEARLARLEADLGKASRVTEREAKRMEQAFGAADATLQRLAGTLGAGLSVAWLTTLAKNTIDGIDKLNDLADATGASIENLSALEDVAVRTGTSMETVGDAVVKLNKLLNDAKPGSDQAAALNAIGLSAAELKRLDPAEALLSTAQALSKYADDGDKARLVQELFGKSAAQLAPLLKDLADKGQLVATVTTEQAKAAEAFNNQINALQKDVTDLSRSAFSPLVDALLQVGGAFKESGDYAGELTGTAAALAVPLQALTVLGANVAFVFRGVGHEIGGLVAQADALRRLDFAGASAIGDEMRASGEAARKRLDDFERRILNLNGATNDALRRSEDRGFTPERRGVGSLPDKAKGGRAERDPFVFQGPELTESMAAALKRLDQVDSVKLAKLREELELLTRMAAYGDVRALEALPGVVEDIAKLEPDAKKAADEMKRLNEILADTPTGKLGSVLSDVELINAAFERGKLSPEQWAEAIRVATSKLGGDTKDALDDINAFAKQAASNIQDALGDTLLAAMDGKFSDIASLWGNLIKRLVAQAAAAELGKALFGADYAKADGKLGGIAADVVKWFKNADGNAFGPGGVVPFANGGVVSQPTLFQFGGGRMGLMGEAGEEGVLPLRRGRDGKLGVISQGGGRPISVTIHMNGMSGGGQNTAMQAGEAIGRQVRLALARNG